MKSKLLLVWLFVFFASFCFAQGYYLEYKMTMAGIGAEGSTKSYYQDGNTRTEAAVARGSFNKTVITLILKDNANKVYLLNPEQKIYDEADITRKDDPNGGQASDYQITVLGKENVDGYNTTHVKILNIKDSAQMEYWTSTEVVGYAEYQKIKNKYSGKESLNKALIAKGVLGFPVRVKAIEAKGTIQLDLVKATKQNNPASLFSLDGYTRSNSGGASPSSASSSTQQEMIQKLQNMTPEERSKYVQQMLQQQQQSQPH